MNKVSISIFHDTRRIKSNGKYPVKLQVYYSGIKMRYPAGIDLLEEEFNNSYKSLEPKGSILYKGEKTKLQTIKNEISALEIKAYKIVETLKRFSFPEFEQRLFRHSSSIGDVIYYYKQTIKQLEKEEKIKTAKNYNSALISLQKFLIEKGKRTNKLGFEEVTVDFLNNYERWMIDKEKSPTTIGFYVRTLRTLFNLAIDNHEIETSIYPFGKRKYVIPTGKKTKRALKKDELKKLYSYPLPDNSPIVKARDFWFFSYFCSGANMADIAALKGKNVTEDSIVFIRTKTRNLTKSNPEPIRTTLTEPLKAIIKKYGIHPIKKEGYVFPILNNNMSAKERVRSIENFTRYINQHFKNLAKLADVTTDISTYHARHSYATVAIQEGASKAYVQQQLGHSNSKTTENYFAGFEDSTRKEVDRKISQFLLIENTEDGN